MQVVGPVAIIGGTAATYSAALSHTSSTLTPLSLLYLFLLALNYSIMPRISKKCIHPQTNKRSLALIEEMVKLCMGIGGFLFFTEHQQQKHMNQHITTSREVTSISILLQQQQWTLASSLLAAGLPSALYAIQGVLTYTSYQNLDSFTFNALTQMKTLSAALCCYWILGKPQSPLQILSLVMLSVTPFLLEQKGKLCNVSNNKQETTSLEDEWKKRWIWGVIPCLGATLLSGLAGALSQRSLQVSTATVSRNAYFYSAEISFFTAMCLVMSMGIEEVVALTQGDKREKLKNGTMLRGKSSGWTWFFEYWSWKTLLPIVVKAMGGILTALVHQHAGSVMKGFSLVLGLILSALLQCILDGRELTVDQVIGTGLVLVSSWLHFTSPPS
jgi:UDP-sugar transporter A1/2/3